jgi:transcriptional regulator with XRE-family HTH domain
MASPGRQSYGRLMSDVTVGTLVRDWRTRRRRSQLDLAIDIGVSARHLSFVETGRSRPSPELVLALADGLDIPLRERNALLLAAGYAPRYLARPLDHESMAPIRAVIGRVLDAHDPYPGVVIDRAWNVVLANSATATLTQGLPPHLLDSPVNVYRVCLHPDGLARRTRNFTEWAGYLLHHLQRTIRLTADPALQELDREVRAYPDVSAITEVQPSSWDHPPLLVPFRLEHGDHVLSMLTTLTTFGTPRDITLDELAVELFYPADKITENLFRGTS